MSPRRNQRPVSLRHSHIPVHQTYLHDHPEFEDLIRIVSENLSLDPFLVEKDYWIMHCLYGLNELGLTFELKGGTSLSKGFKIIDRFSEDIDIRIDPECAVSRQLLCPV